MHANNRIQLFTLCIVVYKNGVRLRVVHGLLLLSAVERLDIESFDHRSYGLQETHPIQYEGSSGMEIGANWGRTKLRNSPNRTMDRPPGYSHPVSNTLLVRTPPTSPLSLADYASIY